MTTTRDKLLELAKEAGFVFHTEPSLQRIGAAITVSYYPQQFERFSALLSQQEQEPEWYTGVDGHGCRRFYHKEEVRPGIGFDECLYLALPPAQGWNEAIEAAKAYVRGRFAGRQQGSDVWLELGKIERGLDALARPSQAQERTAGAVVTPDHDGSPCAECGATETHFCTAAAPDAELLGWAIERWTDEVANRPLINVYRRTLDSTWRQVIRYAGGDDVLLVGPRHDDLVAAAAPSTQPQGGGK